jgi:hypothetical protein
MISLWYISFERAARIYPQSFAAAAAAVQFKYNTHNKGIFFPSEKYAPSPVHICKQNTVAYQEKMHHCFFTPLLSLPLSSPSLSPLSPPSLPLPPLSSLPPLFLGGVGGRGGEGGWGGGWGGAAAATAPKGRGGTKSPPLPSIFHKHHPILK